MGFLGDLGEKIDELDERAKKEQRLKEKKKKKERMEPNETFEGQDIEYKIIEIDRKMAGILSTKAKNPEVKLNRMAAEGWRLVETINEDNGGTQFLILERDVDDSE